MYGVKRLTFSIYICTLFPGQVIVVGAKHVNEPQQLHRFQMCVILFDESTIRNADGLMFLKYWPPLIRNMSIIYLWVVENIHYRLDHSYLAFDWIPQAVYLFVFKQTYIGIQIFIQFPIKISKRAVQYGKTEKWRTPHHVLM
jgi:hypothetical protein